MLSHPIVGRRSLLAFLCLYATLLLGLVGFAWHYYAASGQPPSYVGLLLFSVCAIVCILLAWAHSSRMPQGLLQRDAEGWWLLQPDASKLLLHDVSCTLDLQDFLLLQARAPGNPAKNGTRRIDLLLHGRSADHAQWCALRRALVQDLWHSA